MYHFGEGMNWKVWFTGGTTSSKTNFHSASFWTLMTLFLPKCKIHSALPKTLKVLDDQDQI